MVDGAADRFQCQKSLAENSQKLTEPKKWCSGWYITVMSVPLQGTGRNLLGEGGMVERELRQLVINFGLE